MQTINIEWREIHHPLDDQTDIISSIGGGIDEGPLIVVPSQSFRGPRGRYLAASIFCEVNDYLHHLNRYGEELEGDRFVGLVRGNADLQISLRALSKIQQVLCAGSDGIARIRTKRGGRQAFDHKVRVVLPDPLSIDNIAIESWGEGIYELLHIHPSLKPIIGMHADEDDEE